MKEFFGIFLAQMVFSSFRYTAPRYICLPRQEAVIQGCWAQVALVPFRYVSAYISVPEITFR